MSRNHDHDASDMSIPEQLARAEEVVNCGGLPRVYDFADSTPQGGAAAGAGGGGGDEAAPDAFHGAPHDPHGVIQFAEGAFDHELEPHTAPEAAIAVEPPLLPAAVAPPAAPSPVFSALGPEPGPGPGPVSVAGPPSSGGGRRHDLLKHAQQMEWIAQQTQALELKRQMEVGTLGAAPLGVPTEDPAAPLVATCLQAASSFATMEMEKAAALQQEMVSRGETAVATAKLALQEAGDMVVHTVQSLVRPWGVAAAAVQEHAAPVQNQCFAMVSSGGWASLQQSTFQAACKACDVVMHVLPELLVALQQTGSSSSSTTRAATTKDTAAAVAERHARVLHSLIGVRGLVENFVQMTASLGGASGGASGGGASGGPDRGPLVVALHTMNTLASRANEALSHYNGAKLALQEALQAMDAIRANSQALHDDTVAKCRAIAARAQDQVQDILHQVQPETPPAAVSTGGRGANHAAALGFVARANRQSLLARAAFEVDRLQNLCPPK